MSNWKFQLSALTLAAFISVPAYAQDTASSSATSTVATASGSVSAPSPVSEIDAPEKKSFKERFLEKKDALTKRFHKKKIDRQNEIKNMTPEQRKTVKLNLEEWFKALPLERQDEIRTKMEDKKEIKTEKLHKVKGNRVTTPAASISAPEEVQKVLSAPTVVSPTTATAPTPTPEPIDGM